MIFLNPLYQQLEQQYADKINHFPLVRLSIISLDKTILYTLIFIVLRLFYLKFIKKNSKKIKFGHEFILTVFVMYILLLLFLTVFRVQYFPWQVHIIKNRPLSDINWIPLVQTLKLSQGESILDFMYNLYGNILWFIPFGIMLPILTQKSLELKSIIISGMFLSILIEGLQFLLMTGVSDIDDVIFNTIGVIIGSCIYQLIKKIINFAKQ